MAEEVHGSDAHPRYVLEVPRGFGELALLLHSA